ncbi:arylsulfatase [Blastopirellula marina]|uniref:N-acetylgalactosamine-6-sulfatase n=1 Tax=Blastopirellula marina TaxID=124 RepID=A0A2S8F4K7_9BACT|nr:arylsulfatase [Blastopirellula marina]PQO27083.1 N-acetylgalactosamine-6-sulfatase [Blastopirellula marina]PTL41230.1 N-acetylgalactosamine-6-sulfatase [Blastopirellula marina]
MTKPLATLLFALLALGMIVPLSAQAETKKPNIIYIMADDLGIGDLSCYGQQKFETPNIDRMAAEGMLFTQHYSGSTVCAPTRSVLMTGLHTGHTPVRGNSEVKPVGQQPIPDETVTMPELLKKAGYVTGAFGKWGLGYPGSEGDPINQGFDVFYGYNCQRNAHTYYPTWLYDNEKKIELDGKTYSHDLIMDHALQFIRDNKDKPFYCYLPITIPHAAMHVPEEYVAPFRSKFPEFEDKVGKYAGPAVKNPIAAFAGMCTKMDEDVGRVLHLLKELNLDDNTIVMFTSDNGAHQEGGHNPGFFDSNGPYRGYKRDLTDGGIRAPFIVRWPGHVKAGSTSDLISAHWDVLPTLCQLAGVEVPQNVDGISMVPTLTGEGKQPKHDYLYWEFFERGGKRAVRMNQWKGVQNDMTGNPDAHIALYNIEEDVDESDDVSEKHPEVVAKIRQIFDEAHTENDRFKFKFERK